MGVIRVTDAARIRALAISRVMTKFDDRLKIHSIRKVVPLTYPKVASHIVIFLVMCSPVFQTSSSSF